MEIIKEINKDILTKDICFIPTMGALHKGHTSLIKEGKKSSLPVMVSIFVNQMQFNDKEDFNNYPKPIDEDIKVLENFNIDYLFIPENDYIYPKNNFEKVSSGNLGKLLEGSSRPGHFDGVLTVVNRFFQLINPKIAIFGKKDAQQLFLVNKMVVNKEYEIEIIACPTIRETTGLAFSSRNSLLTNAGKDKAALLYEILKSTKKDFYSRGKNNLLENLSSNYLDTEIDIDYLEILDLATFSKPTENTEEYIILIAANIENLRLIDNIDFKLEDK